MPTNSVRTAVFCLLTACLALLGPAQRGHAQSPVPQIDDAQSMVYWQPFVIDPATDRRVAEAQRIFAVLLRAWDISRLEPALHVVTSSDAAQGPSLADGNILLSRAAIDACFQFGRTRAPHLLAFVLAHELAHQRADDLWHLKFFRLAGTQSSRVQARLVEGLALEHGRLKDVAKREARADHDGLLLMSSVGFDPYQIIDDKDFFTAWVESVWGGSCEAAGGNRACREAQTRALRTRVQLAEVASRATLYDLGVQALVAGKHAEARELFATYGREYPSRAVLTSLGTSYLAEATQAYRDLLASGRLQGADFYYPLLLDSRPQPRAQTSAGVRGSPVAQLPQRIRNLTTEATRYYDRALRLDPGHRPTYLLLALSHLIEGNPYLVRGVVQGRYLPRFGRDAGADLLLAMTHALEGDTAAAERQLEALLRTMDALPSALPRSLLVYTAYHNAAALAELRGDERRARALWKALAERSRSGEGGLLFRLAVARLSAQPDAGGLQSRESLWLVAGARPGERLADSHFEKTAFEGSRIWVSGAPMQVYRSGEGARLVVDDKGIVRHAWQVKTGGQLPAGVAIGDTADRALKALGIPTRHLHLLSGEYLAYDRLGLAVHVVGDAIDGWFLYEPA